MYVDGSNLYYGLLRHTAHKWLDLSAFAKKLLIPEYQIETIKYFTSRVIDTTCDHHRSDRQDKYIDALSCQGISVIEGYYRMRVERLEATENPCKTCPLVKRKGFIRGTRVSEKLTDVNMASAASNTVMCARRGLPPQRAPRATRRPWRGMSP